MRDKEIEVLGEAVEYLESTDTRGKERFLYHLVHRFFPEGEFVPLKTFMDKDFPRPRASTGDSDD